LAAWCPLLGVSLLVAVPVQASLRTWTGNTSGYWSEAGNWSGGVPQSGDDLSFPSGVFNTSNTNNLGLGFTFGQISIAQDRFLPTYTLSGYNITLTGGIDVSGTTFSPTTVALNIQLGGNYTPGIEETFTVLRPLTYPGALDVNGHHLLINAPSTMTFSWVVTDFSGLTSGWILKTNSGALVFPTGAQLETGMTVSQGPVLVDAVMTNGSLVLNASNGPITLSGTGALGTLTLANGAMLSPGDNGPGVFRCGTAHLGNTFYPPGGTLFEQINGTSPGTDYSQLLCSSICNLGVGGAEPQLQVIVGYPSQIGDSFRIIDCGTNGRCVGFFTGLDDYRVVEATNGYSLGVNYATNSSARSS
jgi:hypothetical protein